MIFLHLCTRKGVWHKERECVSYSRGGKYTEPQPDESGANPVYDESAIIFGHSPDKEHKTDNIDERQEIVNSISATLMKSKRASYAKTQLLKRGSSLARIALCSSL